MLLYLSHILKNGYQVSFLILTHKGKFSVPNLVINADKRAHFDVSITFEKTWIISACWSIKRCLELVLEKQSNCRL